MLVKHKYANNNIDPDPPSFINPYHAKPGYISYFENHVDPDQLASQKPADQDPHSFPSACKVYANNWNPAV